MMENLRIIRVLSILSASSVMVFVIIRFGHFQERGV